MSFFDDDDEPTQRTAAQPRRAPGGPRAGGSGGGGGRSADPQDRQQLLVRRAIAAGVGLIVVIILVLGVKACLDSSNEEAMKSYNTTITGIAKSSEDDVTKPLFQDLAAGTSTGTELQTQINQLRLLADENVKRAKSVDVPDDMKKTQQYVILALNLRAGAVAQIAEQIPAATSGKGDPTSAVNRIAGQMQALLASDVIWSQRVQPDMAQAFDNAGIGGQVIPPSKSLTNLAWLTPAFVAQSLGATLSASGTTADGGTPAGTCPSVCGHGLDGVSVGGVDLQPEPAANKPSASPPVTFDVKFTNQGQHDETRVNVTVTITGAGVKTITGKQVVASTKAGTSAEVQIPLATPPPADKPVKITVVVGAVPGEKDTTNNKATYDAVFTTG